MRVFAIMIFAIGTATASAEPSSIPSYYGGIDMVDLYEGNGAPPSYHHNVGEDLVRPLQAHRSLGTNHEASATMEDVVLLPGSSAIGTDSGFNATVCLGRMRNGAAEPLASMNGQLGVVHVRPNRRQDGRVYEFATKDGQSRTYSVTLDESGCIQISDALDFGDNELDREQLFNGPQVEFTYRGRSKGMHDPVSERSYGIVSDILDRVVIVHIQHNLGIKTGRVFLEISQ